MFQASLPMYDLQEIKATTDKFWSLLHEEIQKNCPEFEIPAKLSRPDDLYAHWLDSRLFLSQTCGYPLVHRLKGKVQYIGTPIYDIPGCTADGNYSSIILTRENDINCQNWRQLKFAYNSKCSQSGYNAMKMVVKMDPIDFFENTIETGSHKESMIAVQNSEADICCIDCVSYTLRDRYVTGSTQNLHTVYRSPAITPGLPFITSLQWDEKMLETLRKSIKTVIHNDENKEILECLFLKDFKILNLADYDVIVSESGIIK